MLQCSGLKVFYRVSGAVELLNSQPEKDWGGYFYLEDHEKLEKDRKFCHIDCISFS